MSRPTLPHSDTSGTIVPVLKLRVMTLLSCAMLLLGLMPTWAGINIMTNGPSVTTSNNWSLTSQPTASANPGSFQDLLFQPVNTNDLTQASGNLYSQSINVTNGGAYTLVANSTNAAPAPAVVRPGNTPGNTAVAFVNGVSGGAQDLFFLSNHSSFTILGTNIGGGDPLNVPLQQAGNFNVLTGCTLTINVPITGSSSKKLALIGGGTNVFGGLNTYAGDTVISNGTTLILSGVISNASANPVTVTSNSFLVENATGTIAGTTVLTVTSGSASLSGTNTYTGITTLVDGLQVYGPAALSAASVLKSGGSTGDKSTLTLATASSAYVMNQLSLGGIMKFSGPASGSATITFTNGGVITGGAAQKKIVVDTNVTVVINGPGLEILGAAAVTNRAHTFQADGALTINSPVTATGSAFTAGFTKTGTGLLTLANACSPTAEIVVRSGTLRVDGSITSATVAVGDISTNNSSGLLGTLGGNGTISVPVTVNTNGVLAPGSSIGTLTISSDLTLLGGVAIDVNKSASPSNDVASVSGALANGGVGVVTITNLGSTALSAGDTFKIFNKAVVNGSAMTISGTLPSGLVWTNKLEVDGSVAVVAGSSSTPSITISPSSGSSFNFAWTGSGYHLQAQTNSSVIGLTNNWADYPNGSTSPVNVTPNPANPTVFFRLKSP